MSSRTVQGEREAPGHVAGRRRSRCRRPAAKRGLADFCRLDFANAIGSFVARIRSQCLSPGCPSNKVRLHQGSDLVTSAWTYLIAAGLFEIGWPIGLKRAQEATQLSGSLLGIVVAVVSMAVSGALLYLAQRQIALGTSYAVWTGIGAAGTFLIGVWFFGDPNTLGRWFGAALIVAGVATLKLAH
jgi:quaternary ammonium compound-resistance protein SugE